jgi:hypothetical protein
MQDQLSPALVAAFPEAAHFVLSAQQLACSSIARDVAETLSSVLVYGGDLAALEALAALTGAGVNPGRGTQRTWDENPAVQWSELTPSFNACALCPGPMQMPSPGCALAASRRRPARVCCAASLPR